MKKIVKVCGNCEWRDYDRNCIFFVDVAAHPKEDCKHWALRKGYTLTYKEEKK